MSYLSIERNWALRARQSEALGWHDIANVERHYATFSKKVTGQ